MEATNTRGKKKKKKKGRKNISLECLNKMGQEGKGKMSSQKLSSW